MTMSQQLPLVDPWPRGLFFYRPRTEAELANCLTHLGDQLRPHLGEAQAKVVLEPSDRRKAAR